MITINDISPKPVHPGQHIQIRFSGNIAQESAILSIKIGGVHIADKQWFLERNNSNKVKAKVPANVSVNSWLSVKVRFQIGEAEDKVYVTAKGLTECEMGFDFFMQ